MNKLIASTSVLYILLLCAACKDNPVQEYGTNLSRSVESGKKAAAVADLDTLKKAVESFRAENGRHPEDLNELQRFTGRPIDASRFIYDAQTGTVGIR